MGRGLGITIRDRLITWNEIARGVTSSEEIKKTFQERLEDREISIDSIDKLKREFEEFTRLLPGYPALMQELANLLPEQAILDRENLKNHYDELSLTARQTEQNLEWAKETFAGVEQAEKTILSLDYRVFDDDMAKDVYEESFGLYRIDRFLSRCLRSHMCAEDDLPQIKLINSWGELHLKDVTPELLDRLALRAARRDFKGSCEVCEGWRTKGK